MTDTFRFDLAAIGAGLPATAIAEELTSHLREQGTAVIALPPGTGKTTLVPPLAANLLPADAKTLVCVPRRVAARAAARRLCALSGTRLGEAVGVRVRGESKAGSRVEFVTPGVLLRMLLADPSLESVGTLIFDEVHEHAAEADLAFAFATEVAQLREDLGRVAMSATLGARQFSELLGGAPIVTTTSDAHPYEEFHRPHPARLATTRRERLDFARHLAGLAAEDFRTHGDSVLVFVPGVREVEDTIAACSSLIDAPVLPLHGRLTAREQDAALRRGTTPRIVVATSVAESSLTVPGVRCVVDSGLSRQPRRDSVRGMSGLVTVTESMSSYVQRQGRARREGPGRSYTALSREELSHLRQEDPPELAIADLVPAALSLAAWGAPRGEALGGVLEQLVGARLDFDAAEGYLRSIGGVDKHGSITQYGHELALLPVDPRLGHALLTLGPGAAETVVALADDPAGDVALAQAPRRDVDRLRRLAPGPTRTCTPGEVVGTAFPQAIARSTGAPGEYQLSSGTRARLPRGSRLHGTWLAIASASLTSASVATGGAVIRAAADISEDEALAILGTETATQAELVRGRIRARAVTRAGRIVLSDTPVKPSPEQAQEAVRELVTHKGLQFFTLSPSAEHLRDRLAFLHHNLGAPWLDPDAADPAEWLDPELRELARGASVDSLHMAAALRRLIPWDKYQAFDELAPERLEVPSGSHPRIDYASGTPVVRVKLQECFGMTASPTLAGVPVVFHLLSPAGRELAITDDLASFFSGPYQQVRSEMRGRYPKHPWPEDPFAAQATKHTKKRAARGR